eukprot:757936-Hanusia_phi.AAC.2
MLPMTSSYQVALLYANGTWLSSAHTESTSIVLTSPGRASLEIRVGASSVAGTPLQCTPGAVSLNNTGDLRCTFFSTDFITSLSDHLCCLHLVFCDCHAKVSPSSRRGVQQTLLAASSSFSCLARSCRSSAPTLPRWMPSSQSSSSKPGQYFPRPFSSSTRSRYERGNESSRPECDAGSECHQRGAIWGQLQVSQRLNHLRPD